MPSTPFVPSAPLHTYVVWSTSLVSSTPSVPAGSSASASTRVTIDNADEVSRYYRCRGDAERPAYTPSVQVSAQKVEAIVLAVLRKADPHFISDARSRGLLEHLRPSWDSWSRADRNLTVRNLLWSVRWSPRRGLSGFNLDTIAIDNFIDQGRERFVELPPRGSA